MKKIVVAGAGHGGLTAAFNLSKSGYDVTVIEKNKRADMGYDWHDSLDFSAFDEVGLPRPEESQYEPCVHQAYLSPSGKTKLNLNSEPSGIFMDRKLLISYLIEKAEEAGVKFIFEAEILAPLTLGTKVLGLKYKEKSEVAEFKADLLIDAAGLHSPIRTQLPRRCGILREFAPRDIFYTYRVYYDYKEETKLDPPYNIYLFHKNKPGINWFLTDEGRVDILIGKFGMSGKLTDEEIEEGIADFKERYPFTGDNIIRGGQRGEIPLRRMLPKILCDGYAAIGDSAGMTIPLNGSGIVLSMKAGKILADTVIEAGEKELSTKVLWPYQYNYYMKLGRGLVLIDILKNFFVNINGDHVEFFMEKGILNADNLAFGNGIKITPEFIFHVMRVSVPVMNLLPSLADSFKFVPILSSIDKLMPEEYDEEAFRKWAKMYNRT